MSFTAYRVFNILYFGDIREPILTSLNPRPHYYKYYGPVAVGADPFKSRSNGFYAFKSVAYLDSAFGLMGIVGIKHHFWAEVELYGNVVEHTAGYRAQKLRFAHIYVPREPISEIGMRMLSDRHQCDVTYGDEHPHFKLNWYQIKPKDDPDDLWFNIVTKCP